jgi:hypothetical protein
MSHKRSNDTECKIIDIAQLASISGGDPNGVTLGPAGNRCAGIVGNDITDPPNLADPNSTLPQRLAVGRANALHDLVNNPQCRATPRDQLALIAMNQGQFIGQSMPR